LLVIVYRNTNKSILFPDELKSWNSNLYYQNTKLYINRYFWNQN
jgi:hypothetical protein